jgi:hypothetical protein
VRYYFAWLGSKRAAKRDVAEPGCLLDRAANAKLPVPAGGILLHDFYELAVNEGIVQAENETITAVSPQALHELLYNLARFPRLDDEMVLRPLQNNQFGPTQAPIQPGDAAALANSLCESWQGQNGRHDVLLITHPQATVAGTAVAPANAGSDEIILPEGKMDLAQLGRWQRPDNSLPPHLQRLQMLLRGVRRTFGDVGWEIEWRDDGRICWLWQLKPIG